MKILVKLIIRNHAKWHVASDYLIRLGVMRVKQIEGMIGNNFHKLHGGHVALLLLPWYAVSHDTYLFLSYTLLFAMRRMGLWSHIFHIFCFFYFFQERSTLSIVLGYYVAKCKAKLVSVTF